MKVHKITRQRIYFQMDSGAYGSISREDIKKLRIAATITEEMQIDGRRGDCIVDDIINRHKEATNGSNSPE